MSQVIFDISDGLTLIEHIDSAGMAETVNGVEVFETFGGKCFGDVFITDTIEAVTGKPLSPLVDKKAVLEEGFRTLSIFSDIEFEEL